MLAGRPAETVIIDRHEIFRRGLRTLLEETGEFVVIGEGTTIADARRIMASEHPDVSMLDFELPDGDALQFVRECQAARSPTSCVLVGDGACDRTRLSALLVGAAGVIDKQEPAGAVLDTLRAAVEGRPRDDDTTMEDLLVAIGGGEVGDGDEEATLDRLTPQERRVFELVGQGLANREVAELLFLTEKTVKNYVSRVLTKLGMQRRTEVAVLATRLAVRADHDEA